MTSTPPSSEELLKVPRPMSEARFMIEVINKAVEANEQLMKAHEKLAHAKAEEESACFNVRQLTRIELQEIPA